MPGSPAAATEARAGNRSGVSLRSASSGWCHRSPDAKARRFPVEYLQSCMSQNVEDGTVALRAGICDIRDRDLAARDSHRSQSERSCRPISFDPVACRSQGCGIYPPPASVIGDLDLPSEGTEDLGGEIQIGADGSAPRNLEIEAATHQRRRHDKGRDELGRTLRRHTRPRLRRSPTHPPEREENRRLWIESRAQRLRGSRAAAASAASRSLGLPSTSERPGLAASSARTSREPVPESRDPDSSAHRGTVWPPTAISPSHRISHPAAASASARTLVSSQSSGSTITPPPATAAAIRARLVRLFEVGSRDRPRKITIAARGGFVGFTPHSPNSAVARHQVRPFGNSHRSISESTGYHSPSGSTITAVRLSSQAGMISATCSPFR